MDLKTYKSETKPTWCPGCGDFSVLRSLQSAASKLNIKPHDLAVISGIGCSGRISGYIHGYGFHGIHGRALPVAQGIKLVNPNLTVVAAGGDGDGFAIGTNHTIHAMRRNMDITYIVMNNQVYGLTKGHTSPLSETGFVTKSTPKGSVEAPIKPGLLALAAGATFIAQGFSGFQDQLVDILIKAINHRGFSLVNIFSPCVTFNKINTYQWFRDKLQTLDENHNPYDYKSAIDSHIKTDGLFTGILYINDEKDYYSKLSEEKPTSLVDTDLNILKDFEKLLEEFI